MNKYIINLLCTRQALQILLQVAATRVVLVYNTQARHAITKRSNLVTEIRAVALLSRALCCLFEGPRVCCVVGARGRTLNSRMTCAAGGCACLAAQAREKSQG